MKLVGQERKKHHQRSIGNALERYKLLPKNEEELKIDEQHIEAKKETFVDQILGGFNASRKFSNSNFETVE